MLVPGFSSDSSSRSKGLIARPSRVCHVPRNSSMSSGGSVSLDRGAATAASVRRTSIAAVTTGIDDRMFKTAVPFHPPARSPPRRLFSHVTPPPGARRDGLFSHVTRPPGARRDGLFSHVTHLPQARFLLPAQPRADQDQLFSRLTRPFPAVAEASETPRRTGMVPLRCARRRISRLMFAHG